MATEGEAERLQDSTTNDISPNMSQQTEQPIVCVVQVLMPAVDLDDPRLR